MLTVAGIYRNGTVELMEQPAADITQAPVLVTFLESSEIDLAALGISPAQAAELRAKFSTFEDWNDPAMDIYNDYDAAKASLDEKA
jgi:hypothetical protein